MDKPFNFFYLPQLAACNSSFSPPNDTGWGIKALVFCEGLYGNPFAPKGFFPLRGCITSSIPVSILLMPGAGAHPAEKCPFSAVLWVLGFSARVPTSAATMLPSPGTWLCCRGPKVPVGWVPLCTELWTEASPCCLPLFSSKIAF